jgi:hypothetical protein
MTIDTTKWVVEPTSKMVRRRFEPDVSTGDLVAQAGRAEAEIGIVQKILESPRRDLDARPKVYETFALPG